MHLDKVGKDKRNRYSKRICATRLKAKRLKTNYMTKHRTHNTRLSDNSRIRAILEFHHPHYLHRGATVKAPAIRLLRLASVVMGQCKKQEDKDFV